jgi:hypothetical protein
LSKRFLEKSNKNKFVRFKDGQLSIDEIVSAHKAFVGSEATNYGEQLNDSELDDTRDEL